MHVLHYTVSWIIRLITAMLCRVDAAQLRRLPIDGPCIIVTNHINFLEIPVLYTRLMPRKLAALVKAETWNNPAMAFLGNLWRGIPITRGVVDRQAILYAKESLNRQEMLFIAPEGTRSGTGKLRRGNPGVVLLAADTEVPIFPVAHFGGERFWQNIRRFRRTDFAIRVGRPFIVRTGLPSLSRQKRGEIADDIMLRIAELLPLQYRGHYSRSDGWVESSYLFPV